MGILKCNRFGMNEACKRVAYDTWNSTIIKATVFLDVLSWVLLGSQQRLSPFSTYKNNLYKFYGTNCT